MQETRSKAARSRNPAVFRPFEERYAEKKADLHEHTADADEPRRRIIVAES